MDRKAQCSAAATRAYEDVKAQMDPKVQSSVAATRVYEDFAPPFEWSGNGECNKLVLVLPGFRKEHLKIQVISNLTLRINGEQPLKKNIWRRFTKEFPLSSDSDTNEISARFEGTRLSVMIPKMTPQSELPTVESTTQEVGQQVPSDPRNHKETEPDANKAKAGELNEGSTSKPNEGQVGKIMRRLKTRVVETLSLRPSDRHEDEDAEVNSDLAKGSWKLKQLMSLIVAVVLLVLVLGLFAKNAIK